MTDNSAADHCRQSPGVVLEDVRFSYDSRMVLDGVSLRVEPSAPVVVRGSDGVGKSTLLYVASGLLAPSAGRVLISGSDLAELPCHALFTRGIRFGFVFQNGGLVSNLTVLANVTLPLAYHRRELGLSRTQVDARAREALDRAGVGPEFLDRLPAHTSQGVRRRVSIARVLGFEPNVLFFDDPDAGLDPDQASGVSELVIEMLRRPDVCALLTTTNPALARRAGGRLVQLADGRLHHVQGAEVPA